MNLAGYASLIVPAYFYKRYLDKQGYKSKFKISDRFHHFLDNGSNKTIINFFYGADIGEVQPDEENLIKKESSTPKPERTLVQTALRLVFCATGLYVSLPSQIPF